MCEWGDTVPIIVTTHRAEFGAKGKLEKVAIDRCIAPIVDALETGGIHMWNSCCGHGKAQGYINLHDGRVLLIQQSGVRYVVSILPK